MARTLAVLAVVAVVTVAGDVATVGSQPKPAAKKLDIADLLAVPEAGAVGLKYMAEEVTKRSNGSLNMIFHGGTLLNKELEIMDAVKSGKKMDLDLVLIFEYMKEDNLAKKEQNF